MNEVEMLCRKCCTKRKVDFSGEAYWARCDGCDAGWTDVIEVHITEDNRVGLKNDMSTLPQGAKNEKRTSGQRKQPKPKDQKRHGTRARQSGDDHGHIAKQSNDPRRVSGGTLPRDRKDAGEVEQPELNLTGCAALTCLVKGCDRRGYKICKSHFAALELKTRQRWWKETDYGRAIVPRELKNDINKELREWRL